MRTKLHRLLLILLVGLFSIGIRATESISIPLKMSVFSYMPMDKPTGSTPDPTDPNQFRVTLTGNTLFIETQEGQLSYVVIQEASFEYQDKDYFYAISMGAVSCPIKRAGEYTIRIGCWKTDFIGSLSVSQMSLYDLNGHYWGNRLDQMNELPAGYYILQVDTNYGRTTTKFYKSL